MAARLFRSVRAVDAGRTAIIDIGSNSIRLVVYGGPPRVPAVLFNEKVMAGLGRALSETGAIDAAALASARTALARFAWLAREMEVDSLRTVATAAVREASNGDDLIAAAEALGLSVELLSGDDEATAAGLGVLSAIPDADGIVGDLGGGSLELVRVVAGTITDRTSFPLGVLRLGAIRKKSKMSLERRVAKYFADAGWVGRGRGLPLYMVGGSWRTLTRLDMHLTGYSLPVVHGYEMRPPQIERLSRTIAQYDKGKIKALMNVSSARLPTLEDAATMLGMTLKQLGCDRAIASAFGLREGLLYAKMPPAVRAEDPLIAAARDDGERLGRFPEHGDLLDKWIAPLFAAEASDLARLRHAACLLADVGWRANPEFRAERGVEIALHGNWIAIDARGRALIAQALYTSLGGGTDMPDPLGRLAPHDELALAVRWGLAIRLGQRLSGGLAAPLMGTSLSLSDGSVTLSIADAPEVYGEMVERRHRVLAGAMGRVAAVA